MGLTAEILARYEEYFAALFVADRAFFERVLDDGFFSTDPSGRLRTKAEYLDHLPGRTGLEIALDDVLVREIAPGVAAFSAGVRMGEEAPIRVLGIWGRQRDGSWRYLAQQGTLVSERPYP